MAHTVQAPAPAGEPNNISDQQYSTEELEWLLCDGPKPHTTTLPVPKTYYSSHHILTTKTARYYLVENDSPY